jgi:putative phosphoesterase
MPGKMTEIAIVSDIHGNSWAFEAVLTDIKSRGIKTIINLGDSLYGPLDPRGTCELLMDNNVLSISGNEDRIILEHPGSKPESGMLEYVKSQIDKDVVNWLKSLPFELIFSGKIYCCHGTPQSDSAYLLERVLPGYISLKEKTEIDDLLKDVQQNVVTCGHSHMQGMVAIGNKTIVNPGSVGCPAFEDDHPLPHKVENHQPDAKYCVVKFSGKLVNTEHINVPYDFEQAARRAEKNNRKDWAKWIRTGTV